MNRLIALIFLAILQYVKSTDVNCVYSIDYVGSLGYSYICTVQYPINITTLQDANITSVTGTHLNEKDSFNVDAIVVNSKPVNYFPHGFDKIFPNLRGIRIIDCNLMEIHQSDLQAFPNLTYLSLNNNEIQSLEHGLFYNNPNLDYIELGYNKISQINHETFDNLQKLNYLNLESNLCINGSAVNSTEVQILITEVKNYCSIQAKAPHHPKLTTTPISTTTTPISTTTTPISTTTTPISTTTTPISTTTAPISTSTTPISTATTTISTTTTPISTTRFFPTTTTASDFCPRSCVDQISALSMNLSSFKTSNAEQLKKTDDRVRGLTFSTANTLFRLDIVENLFQQELEDHIVTVHDQIDDTKSSLQASIAEIKSDLTQKLEDFEVNSFPSLIEDCVNKAVNMSSSLIDEFKSTQNEINTELRGKIGDSDNNLSDLRNEISVKIQNLESKLAEEHAKVLSIIDELVAVLRKESSDGGSESQIVV